MGLPSANGSEFVEMALAPLGQEVIKRLGKWRHT